MRASLRRSGILSVRSMVGPVLAASVAALALPALVLPGAGPLAGPALAQSKAGSDDANPKQVALTQQKIDSLIAAQTKIREVESKQPQGKDGQAGADAKVEKQIAGIVTSNGFASANDFADTNFSVGMVLSGMDPESGSYIGTEAALKKQVAEVKADKKMPANERKEALDELNEALKSASTEKPLPGNVDLVKANFKKLSEGLQGGD